MSKLTWEEGNTFRASSLGCLCPWPPGLSPGRGALAGKFARALTGPACEVGMAGIVVLFLEVRLRAGRGKPGIFHHARSYMHTCTALGQRLSPGMVPCRLSLQPSGGPGRKPEDRGETGMVPLLLTQESPLFPLSEGWEMGYWLPLWPPCCPCTPVVRLPCPHLGR